MPNCAAAHSKAKPSGWYKKTPKKTHNNDGPQSKPHPATSKTHPPKAAKKGKAQIPPTPTALHERKLSSSKPRPNTLASRERETPPAPPPKKPRRQSKVAAGNKQTN